MTKIWLKSADPQGVCCDCAGKTGPCDSCAGCVFNVPTELEGSTPFPDLATNNTVMAANKATFTIPEQGCYQYAPALNPAFAQYGVETVNSQSASIDLSISKISSTQVATSNVSDRALEVISTFGISLAADTILDLTWTVQTFFQSPLAGACVEFDFFNITTSNTYTYSHCSASNPYSDSHSIALPAGIYQVVVSGYDSDSAQVDTQCALVFTAQDETPNNMTWCSITSSYLSGLDVLTQICST